MIHWNEDGSAQWATVGDQVLHVQRSELTWIWFALGETGAAATDMAAREAAETATVAYLARLAADLGYKLVDVP